MNPTGWATFELSVGTGYITSELPHNTSVLSLNTQRTFPNFLQIVQEKRRMDGEKSLKEHWGKECTFPLVCEVWDKRRLICYFC